VLPVDRRLPDPAKEALLTTMGVDAVVDDDGEHARPGRGAEPGDALVVPTSGSTGVPKGVVLTHTAVLAAAQATSARLGITNRDTWLACLPLAHVGGLGVVTRALLTGTGLVVHDGFDATAVRAAAHGGATAVSLVATALRRVDPALFRLIVLGGARPPEDLPANVTTTYGLTETGGGVVYDRRPLDGVEMRSDPTGELLVRGPMLMRCYRDGSTAVDADGWLHTGDIGTIAADGSVAVRGRRGDLIITGGENVWPDVVENALRTHPGIDDVAVAGVDDDEWGQRVVAWVVPTERAAPTLVQLRAHTAEQLPAFMAPKEIRLVEAIPRTSLGKVARHQLT
jgi:o-succinylbenzoate---CoA ligase